MHGDFLMLWPNDEFRKWSLWFSKDFRRDQPFHIQKSNFSLIRLERDGPIACVTISSIHVSYSIICLVDQLRIHIDQWHGSSHSPICIWSFYFSCCSFVYFSYCVSFHRCVVVGFWPCCTSYLPTNRLGIVLSKVAGITSYVWMIGNAVCLLCIG